MLREDYDFASLVTFEKQQSMHKIQISDYIKKYFT